MRLTRLIAGLVLVLATFLGAIGDSDAAPPLFKRMLMRPMAKKPADTTASKPTDADDPLTAPLVSPSTLAKLKLTSEQKPKVADLQKEFAAKLKEIAALVKKNNEDNPAPAKGAKVAKTDDTKVKGKGKGKGKFVGKKGPDNTEEYAKANDLRSEYEDKLNELLTDAQKKVLDDIKIAQGEAALKASANAPDSTPKKKK